MECGLMWKIRQDSIRKNQKGDIKKMRLMDLLDVTWDAEIALFDKNNDAILYVEKYDLMENLELAEAEVMEVNAYDNVLQVQIYWAEK